jgi:HSP20 family protein
LLRNKKKKSNKKDDYVRKEFNHQSFYRSFNLPDFADENKIAATYKDAFLKVIIAKNQVIEIKQKNLFRLNKNKKLKIKSKRWY